MPDDAGDDHHHDGDHQRDAGAIDQARKHVAADRIGAEQVRAENQSGGRIACARSCLLGSYGAISGASSADDDQDQHDHAAGHDLRRQPRPHARARSRRARLSRALDGASASRVALFSKADPRIDQAYRMSIAKLMTMNAIV